MQFDELADPEALPVPNAVSAPFFAAAAGGELVFQRCARGHAFLYARSLCPVCHSTDLTWESSAGRGEVVTFSVVHRPPWNDLPRPVPYVVALVRLDEGPQLLSTIEGTEPGEVRIGQAVQAGFERVDEAVGLVRFHPVDTARS
ncbi:DNA-binding protein [Thermoleophilia bacterium SCSIO 60948]|nr:DNA-binding protein [Thermoleophilia bacterium SCSIO 60948]